MPPVWFAFPEHHTAMSGHEGVCVCCPPRRDVCDTAPVASSWILLQMPPLLNKSSLLFYTISYKSVTDAGVAKA